MSIKDDLYYSEDHEWVREEEDYLVIGVTDFAQEELGDIVFVELPTIDDLYNKDDSIAILESVKAVSDIYTPVSGSVINVNYRLEDEPDLINKDPEGEGWILEMQINDVSELKHLMVKSEYEEFIM
jgi:glycine cleavage system H protein